MDDIKTTKTDRRSRETRLESLLRGLQAEVEAQGTEESKRERRQVLRGLRLACWVCSNRVPIDQTEREFRDELFRAKPIQ